MAWCRQATSHNLNRCWLISLMPYQFRNDCCVIYVCVTSYNTSFHVSIVESSWLLPMAWYQVGRIFTADPFYGGRCISGLPRPCVSSYHSHVASCKTVWFVGTIQLWDNMIWLFARQSNIVGFVVCTTSKLPYGTKISLTHLCKCIARHYFTRHTKLLKSFKQVRWYRPVINARKYIL